MNAAKTSVDGNKSSVIANKVSVNGAEADVNAAETSVDGNKSSVIAIKADANGAKGSVIASERDVNGFLGAVEPPSAPFSSSLFPQNREKRVRKIAKERAASTCKPVAARNWEIAAELFTMRGHADIGCRTSICYSSRVVSQANTVHGASFAGDSTCPRRTGVK